MYNKSKNAIKGKIPTITGRQWLDFLTLGIGLIALFLLFALIYVNVAPIKTADIKVPVATDKSSYYPGQDISGIFFGETYYEGEIRVLREVFCKDYKATIKPSDGNAFGNFFSTQTKPRKFEGQSVYIGKLPSDIPIGLNCVLQFTNVYDIQTPFGERTERYQYYTQNFAIISKERRDQLDCEATGRSTADCSSTDNATESVSEPQSDITSTPQSQITPTRPNQTESNTTNNVDNSTTNNTTNTTPTQPAPQPVEVCAVNLLGIKTLCRIEYR